MRFHSIVVVEKAGGEHEVGAVERRRFDREAVEQPVVARRPQMIAGAAETGDAPGRHRLAARLARGDDIGVERPGNADIRETAGHPRGAPGRVRQQQHGLAGVGERGETFGRAGIGRRAVHHHPPDIEDERVETVGERRKAREAGDGHGGAAGAPLFPASGARGSGGR